MSTQRESRGIRTLEQPHDKSFVRMRVHHPKEDYNPENCCFNAIYFVLWERVRPRLFLLFFSCFFPICSKFNCYVPITCLYYCHALWICYASMFLLHPVSFLLPTQKCSFLLLWTLLCLFIKKKIISNCIVWPKPYFTTEFPHLKMT